MININVQVTSKIEETNSVKEYLKKILDYAERNQETGILIKMDGKAIVLRNFDYEEHHIDDLHTIEFTGTCDRFTDEQACVIIQKMLDYANCGHVLVITRNAEKNFAYSNRDHKIWKSYIHPDGNIASNEFMIKQFI